METYIYENKEKTKASECQFSKGLIPAKEIVLNYEKFYLKEDK